MSRVVPSVVLAGLLALFGVALVVHGPSGAARAPAIRLDLLTQLCPAASIFPAHFRNSPAMPIRDAQSAVTEGLVEQPRTYLAAEGYREGCRLNAHDDPDHEPDHQQGLDAEVDVYASAGGAATSLGNAADPRAYSDPAMMATRIPPVAGFERALRIVRSGKKQEIVIFLFARRSNVVLTLVAFAAHQTAASTVLKLRSLLASAAPGALASLYRPEVLVAANSVAPFASVTMRGSSTVWRMTLLHTYLAAHIGPFRAQGKFLVAVLKVQNVGNAPADFPFDTTLTALDAAARTFSAGTNDVGIANDAAAQFGVSHIDALEAIQPASASREIIVFDVAGDADGVDLMFNTGFAGNSYGTPIFPLGA